MGRKFDLLRGFVDHDEAAEIDDSTAHYAWHDANSYGDGLKPRTPKTCPWGCRS